MRILCLAPHPDDLALSIGGILARLADRAAVSAVTVFGRCGWARPGFDLAGRSITAVRHAEELRFFAAAGVVGRILALPDAALRGYSDVSEVRSDPQRAGTTAAVMAELAQVAREALPLVTFAPAAIGGHVDHVAVRDAAIRLRSLCGTLVFYEDLPYAARPPAVSRLESLRDVLGGTYSARPVRISLTRKRRFLALYPSQLSDHDIRVISRHACHRGACHGPVERIFVRCAARSARLLDLLA